jgi:two-component system response regulator HydG
MESGIVPFFTSEAIDLLVRHPWLGNVRELEHAVRRTLLISPRFPVSAPAVQEALEAGAGGVDEPVGPWSGRIRPLREWQDEAIRQALLHTGGNKTAAAVLLGVHRNTLVLRARQMANSRAGNRTKARSSRRARSVEV